MGTSTISVIVERLPSHRAHPLLTAGVLLVIVGAFTRRAVPVPLLASQRDGRANTGVGLPAFGHDGEAGVYLLARLDAGLDDWLLWQVLLQGAGSITAAWGMVLALRGATSSASWPGRRWPRWAPWNGGAGGHAGRRCCGGCGRAAAGACAVAPLFFVAGNVDHGTGTRAHHRPTGQPAPRHAVDRGGGAGRHVDGGHPLVVRLRGEGPDRRRQGRPTTCWLSRRWPARCSRPSRWPWPVSPPCACSGTRAP